MNSSTNVDNNKYVFRFNLNQDLNLSNLHFSLRQGDQCFHFFQLKNISFCGCHPKHSKWDKLGFNLDDDVINKSVQIQLQAVRFQSNADYLVAGILVSSPSIPTNSDLPVMWWCQRQHYTLWLSLWGETSSLFYSFSYPYISTCPLCCLSMHVCSYTQNRDYFRESKSSENSCGLCRGSQPIYLHFF